jgi:hypothetical protein
MTKLDRLETLVTKSPAKGKAIGSRDSRARLQSGRPGMTASDTALEFIKEMGDEGAIIKRFSDVITFSEN